MSDLPSDQHCDNPPANVAVVEEGSTAIFKKNSTDNISDGNNYGTSSVQVAVRVRPMLPNEAGTTECVDVLHASIDQVEHAAFPNVLRLGGSSGPKFTFDQVFGAQTLQSQVYQDRVAPLVANCLEGYNATVLAYGQTASGKTHTIMGGGMASAMMQEEEAHQGVLPRAIRNIFQQLNKQQESSNVGSSYEYEVRVQFLEIYGEEIRDLLNPRPNVGTSSSSPKLSIRDVGNAEPEVVGATMHKVDSADEALLCLTSGMYRRVTGSTAMNESSSRSHAILSIVVEQANILKADPIQQSTTITNFNGTSTKEEGNSQIQDSEQHVQLKVSRFNFVDLAGSERQKRTQATGQRLKEGIDINKGLLVLGNVISALGDSKKQGAFVPYRDSKLTRLLKGSLGGNHKTLMIACVSPSSSNMEETLNCLRYANRAKNIQNHAVVNLDTTSQIVAGLKGKIQRLAIDLIKARRGEIDECSFPLSVIEALANGSDADVENNTRTTNSQSISSNSDEIHSPFRRKYQDTDTSTTESNAEAQKLRTENEVFRLQVQSLSQGKDPSDALQKAYVTKAIEYEREISRLKKEIQTNTKCTTNSLQFREIRRNEAFSRNSKVRSESPELSRLKSQIFGSLSKSSTLDAEMDAEEKAVNVLSKKYLSHPIGDGEFIEEDGDDNDHAQDIGESIDTSASLDADLFALSTSISAKEALIHQLQSSQEKFESMREFYEEKLKEMETIVSEKEAETEKLSEEIKKLDEGHSKSKELSDMLKQKQRQVKELKKKKSELARLTNVASRNETQINRLKNDVRGMKQKKVDLQKQITAERKSHLLEVKKLKKESMKKDRELNKVKREASKKSQEALKAQKIAKSRLDQMSQLKKKYKDTEKRLRMQTVKRGVLKKAGLDPVIFGRRQSRDSNEAKLRKGDWNRQKVAKVDELRDFFDQKVADVGRRENIAEKLAQEWEEHQELTDEFLESDAVDQHESIIALQSAIKYREERIRHLASQLGKREKRVELQYPHQGDEAFLFNKEFHGIIGKEPIINGTKIAAKVLFGMVVRERRRIASLARTASSLDEKVLETELSLADKDAAFRAYVDEQRIETASLAQSQQEHILSLMEMVKEGQIDEFESPGVTHTGSFKRRESFSSRNGNPRLLVLANERIDALERQLNETQISRDAMRRHQEQEQSVMSILKGKSKECEVLEDEITELRSALLCIQEEASFRGHENSDETNGGEPTPLKKVQGIVVEALHSSSVSTASKSRRRSSAVTKRGNSPSLAQRITSEVDSSDSDEIPDWAEDIMLDLAIIADGRMPSSLLQSQEVLEAEAQLNDSVFDRLTNPESFTGVQKQRNAKTNRSRYIKSAPSINSDVQTSRKVASFQGVDTVEMSTIPDEKEKKKENVSKKSKEKFPMNIDSAKRTVFDRLLSPSNLTGTQKQRFHRIHDQKGRTLEKAIENQHVSLRGRSRVTDYESDEIEEDESEVVRNDMFITQNRDSDVIEKKNELHNSSKLDEYSRLDVFERLNKTTTQAYKEKVHTNIAEKMLDDILLDNKVSDEEEIDCEEENSRAEPQFERLKEYTKEDVFERLQRTTTEAYAKKKNNLTEDAHISSSLLKIKSDRNYSSDSPDANLSPPQKRNLWSD